VTRHRRLPSTTSLRAFEAVARFASFSAAASAIGMTQGAVSKQVKALEEFLGVRLIARTARGPELTNSGRRYYAEVAPCLDRLAEAGDSIGRRTAKDRSVRVRGLASLGERWLLPRVPDFMARYPHIDLQFSTFLLVTSYDAGEADAEFRFGNGDWPGARLDYLVGQDVALVIAPRLIAAHGAPASAADVGRFTLLEHLQATEVWNEFSRTFGQPVRPRAQQIVRYEIYSVLITAAAAGLGIALIPRCLIGAELVSGALIDIPNLGFRSRLGYYLSIANGTPRRAAVADFRAWLLEQARLTEPLTNSA
jgi:LysR family transcriptional regulator, glycine cleavage system transcriptional activator